MPVKSYLVFPHKGKQNQLSKALLKLPWCEIATAKNKELLVLTTDTQNEIDEEKCLKYINSIEWLEHLTLVSGFEENKN